MIDAADCELLTPFPTAVPPMLAGGVVVVGAVVGGVVGAVVGAATVVIVMVMVLGWRLCIVNVGASRVHAA
jgi:hypothetical protein